MVLLMESMIIFCVSKGGPAREGGGAKPDHDEERGYQKVR